MDDIDSTPVMTSDEADLVEDDEHDSKERVLHKYFLQEWVVVKSVLDSILSNGGVSRPPDVQKIRSIMDKYQEQGQLLEPYLESIVSPLMLLIREKATQPALSTHQLLQTTKPLAIIVYSLVTVCGYKSVVRFFPHHVSDLEPAVGLLEKCHHATSATSLRQESTGEMEMKCVLLLWLYVLVLIPFDIASVDTSTANGSGGGCGEDDGVEPSPPLVLKIVGFSKDYLCDAGPMRRISGLLLSRLLTRRDTLKAFTSFLEWTHQVLLPVADNVASQFTLLGIVEALASIFRVGSQNILLNASATIWDDISILVKSTTALRSSLLRKFNMKLAQRIALVCLPHRSPSWRYMVRKSSLGEATSSTSVSGDPYNNVRDGMCHEGEMDIPEIIEEIMELLLSGLRDSDTVVRWSAAKGIGRITARLTSSLLEDIFLSILELFSPGEGDGSWHGGCLAIAELARRGLLLPATLPKAVPVIVKALHYDIRRGPHSVGSHVRDAAAYVCWAFGRAYSHSDMKATLEQLSPHLLTVACYDREVNCRRAAAAAFQENIGRQGTFPNGINIVNAADYFSLSSRANSYCHVATYIAQYKEYLYPFAEELMYHKIPHWDKSVREVAAVALSTLAKYDLEYFAEHILNKLIPCTLSSDLCMRHGATLAAGELVIGLLQCGFIVSTEKQKSLSAIVPAIEKARLYRGKGGEIMRLAVSRFIECISLSRVLLSEKIKSSLLDTLNDNLKHPNVQIQCSAVDALKHFIRAYIAGGDSRVANDLTWKYLKLLKDPNPAARRGSALVIGILPFECLAPIWRDVLSKLSASCIIEATPDDHDAEVRVNAVRSLVLVCETLTSTRSLISDNTEEGSFLFLRIKHEVIQVLFRALDDYTIDNRGDVGSWVRDAAIDGLERCTYILCRKDSDGIPKLPSMEIPSVPDLDLIARDPRCLLFDADTATNLIGGIAKQAVEKLDKLRESAVKVLHRILYSQKFPLALIPHVEAIKEIIPSETNFKWGVPKLSFPCLVKLLQFPCYSKAVLSGLVISVGGLQDSLRKVSLAVLLEYIQDSESNVDGNKLSREYMLSHDLLWILKHYQKSDRVIVPTLKTIEILLSKKIFSDMKMGIPFDEQHDTWDFYVGVLDSLTIELKATKDFSKLLMGLSILGFIASSTECINSSAFTLLISFLAHRYPKIRKASADQVYLVILQNENLVAPNKREEALEVVTETCWEGDIDEAKCRRAQLSVMVGVDVEIITREPKKDY